MIVYPILQLELRGLGKAGAAEAEDNQEYEIELTYSHSSGDSTLPSQLARSSVRIDWKQLAAAEPDDAEYGAVLTSAVLGEAVIRAAFTAARKFAQIGGTPLRIRILIDTSAARLHWIRWERLMEPGGERFLAAVGEELFLTRYVISPSLKLVQRRAVWDQRVLVAVASPTDLDQYTLAEIDAEAEVARAKSNLKGLNVRSLSRPEPVSIRTLQAALLDRYDVFYLVCHGGVAQDGTLSLWLEHEGDRTAEVVDAKVLVDVLTSLEYPPLLVVLASCYSAGDQRRPEREEAITLGLGPHLAEQGIPAVIGMQGRISVETAGRFVSAFFESLVGQNDLDRAVAVARQRVSDRPDWLMPVLFTRLVDGRIYSFTPGFQEGGAAPRWPSLLTAITAGQCTPVLGPGMVEPFFGTRSELARELAQKNGFPLARYQSESLPHVAQHIATVQDTFHLRREFVRLLQKKLISRFGAQIPDAGELSLAALVRAVAAHRRATNPNDPYRILAGLRLPLYVTADPTDALLDALKENGCTPEVEIFRWRDDLDDRPSIFNKDEHWRPTPECPLIFHLLGHIEDLKSLVLSLDDHYDYLTAIGYAASQNPPLYPRVVAGAPFRTSLLFLGFQYHDWDFLLLFRSIMQAHAEGKVSYTPGFVANRLPTHVAAQVNPDDAMFIDSESARHHLQRYFTNARVDLYQGTVDSFVADLKGRLEAISHE